MREKHQKSTKFLQYLTIKSNIKVSLMSYLHSVEYKLLQSAAEEMIWVKMP